MTDDPIRNRFEAVYATRNRMDLLELKMLRSSTGGYRDSVIATAWFFFLEGVNHG